MNLKSLHKPALGLWAICFCLIFLLPSGSGAFQGPLRVNNSFPPFQGLTAPALTDTEPVDQVSLQTGYSSTYLVRTSADWSFLVDLETFVAELEVRKKISDSFELSLALPLISHNSGFLDGFLESYHSAFDFPDYGRSERRLNNFLFEISHEGRPVVVGKAGRTGPGDLRLGFKAALLRQDPTLALFAFMEFPTGDARRGFGSGSFDGGGGLAAGKRFAEHFRLMANLGFFVPGGFEAIESLDTEPFIFAGLDAEWMVNESWALNAQVSFQQSPLEKTGISQVDDTSVILSFGTGIRLSKKSRLQVTFSEDPGTAGAPDFMLAAEMVYEY